MSISPVALTFNQPWLSATSPISLLFGNVVTPIKKQEIGVFYTPVWQPSSLVKQQQSLIWVTDTVKNHLILSTTRILLTRYSELHVKHRKLYTVVFSFTFKNQKLRNAQYNIYWRNSQLNSSAMQISFNNKPLKQKTTVLYLAKPSKNLIQDVLCWKEAKIFRIDRIANWLGVNAPTKLLTTIKYGITPLNLICYHKNNPVNGVVTLNFTEQTVNTAGPLTMALNPFQKICYWGNGGGLIRASDDLPVLNRKIPIKPQLRSSYIMQPTINCIRVSDNLAILITSFTYNISREQFAATTSIKFSSRIDYERAQNELLKIIINGYEFYTFVEKVTENKSFNQSSYTATGRSRFAELSFPYRRPKSFTNEVARSLVGLMSDSIQSTSWTISSNIVDYPVPAFAFSYKDKTPAQALAICAQAVGAMLDINDASRSISVIPKWPVMPWDTDTATPDIVLNESLIISHTITKLLNQPCNVVIVRGEQQGIEAKVKRAGSTGNLFANDITDKLITDIQAARQRGSCELANTGNKEQSIIRTKIMADLPPIKPGMLIGIQYESLLYKATCDSASYTANVDNNGKITINQTITLIKNVD